MRADIGNLLLEIGMKIVARRIADEPRPSAVSAVSGATIRHQEKNAVWIAMHQPWHRRMLILATRIAHFPWSRVRFLDPRNDLPPDRAILIRGIDQVEKVRRDRQRQPVISQGCAGIFL